MSVVNVTFPGNLAQVDTAADLRGVPSSFIESGSLYLVADLRSVFAYDPGAVDVDDGLTVLKPNDRTTLQAGRWIKSVNGLAPGSRGDPGPADNTYTTLAALLASDPTRKSARLVGDPSNPDGNFNYRDGAWVRQKADGVVFQANGTGALARTTEAKLRDIVSLADFCAPSDATAGFNAIKALYPNGCKIMVPAGTWTLTDTVTFDGQRVMIEGAGRNVSLFVFNPVSPKAAFLLNNPALGGIYQSSISDIGFTSSNSVNKTAIELRNAADTRVERIGIAGAAWPGAMSRGVATFGRQSFYLSQCQIVCAQPLYIGPNATFPTLCTDHFAIHDNELSANGPTYSAVTIADGVTLSQIHIHRCAITGGRYGIEWFDSTSTGASNEVHIQDCRFEQGSDPAAYSIAFSSTAQTLQGLLIERVTLDSARNGIFLRNVQRAVMTEVLFNQGAGQNAIDMTGVPGSELLMFGCGSQVGGSRTLTNMRSLLRVDAFASGSAIGPLAIWRYEPVRAFASGAQDYLNLMPVREQNTRIWNITDTLPVGASTVTLPLVIASQRVTSRVTLRTSAGAGTAGYGVFFVLPSGTIVTDTQSGNVNLGGGADTCRIVAGSALQLIGDGLTAPINYTLHIEADYAS